VYLEITNVRATTECGRLALLLDSFLIIVFTKAQQNRIMTSRKLSSENIRWKSCASAIPSFVTRRSMSPFHGREAEEEKLQSNFEIVDGASFLSRSSSYALQRTGTINSPKSITRLIHTPKKAGDDEEEETIELSLDSSQSSSLSSETEMKKKSVSFSSINFHIYTESTLTQKKSSFRTSIEIYEKRKHERVKPNEKPYHLRFKSALSSKEELRKRSSLVDKPSRWQRLPRIKKMRKKSRAFSQEESLSPSSNKRFMYPPFATNINMAGELNSISI
jgi:hypothetical protein